MAQRDENGRFTSGNEFGFQKGNKAPNKRKESRIKQIQSNRKFLQQIKDELFTLEEIKEIFKNMDHKDKWYMFLEINKFLVPKYRVQQIEVSTADVPEVIFATVTNKDELQKVIKQKENLEHEDNTDD